jgi:membrane AbrB-like protein
MMAWRESLPGLWRLLATLACATGGGELAAWVHMPLPWLLGAMGGVACISLVGQVHKQPALARKGAQIYIGTTLGLFFTPIVLHQIGGLVPWMVVGVVTGILMSAISARVLQRWAGVDGPTAIYAVALGAAAEMAVQAQRAGADGAVVASAHAVRIMMVTFTATMIAWVSGTPVANPLGDFALLSLAVSAALLLAATGVGLVFQHFKLPNPWVLGAMVVGGLCASQEAAGRLPNEGLLAAQLVIGWGLGQHITPDFFSRAPRTLACVAMVTLGILGACMGMAWVISMGAHMPVMTAFLSMAPGGMTEMSVISKAFGLGAPIVTAFHMLRILATIFLTQPMARSMLSTGWVRQEAAN